MPESARVLVIGGVAVGASCLYHLAELGWTDALQLDRDELTSGSNGSVVVDAAIDQGSCFETSRATTHA